MHIIHVGWGTQHEEMDWEWGIPDQDPQLTPSVSGACFISGAFPLVQLATGGSQWKLYSSPHLGVPSHLHPSGMSHCKFLEMTLLPGVRDAVFSAAQHVGPQWESGQWLSLVAYTPLWH